MHLLPLAVLCFVGVAAVSTGLVWREDDNALALTDDDSFRIFLEKDKLDTDGVVDIADNLEVNGISLKLLYSCRSSDALERRVILPGLKDWIDEKIRTEYAMNIKTAFLLLGKVGQLLRVAYAGCKGYQCQVSTVKVHSRYQDLIYDSARVGANFVSNSLRSIKYHYYAEKRYDNMELTKAFEWIKRTASIADKMVKDSQMMEVKAEELRGLAEDALLQANSDDVLNKAQIDEMKKKMANITATHEQIKAELKEETTAEKKYEVEIQKAIKAALKWETDFGKEAARKIKEYDHCIVMPNAVGVGPLKVDFSTKTCTKKMDQGDVLAKRNQLDAYEKQIQKYRKMELELLKTKRKIQEKNAILYGELAATIENQVFNTKTATELERARKSLNIAIQVLAIVKTIFSSVLQFWLQVSTNAQDLGKDGVTMTTLKDLGVGDEDMFYELLVESGFSWFAIGKVSNDAKISMLSVKNDVTAGFIDMPDDEQAKVLVKTAYPLINEVKEMIKDLGSNRNVTDAQIEAATSQVKLETELTAVPTTTV